MVSRRGGSGGKKKAPAKAPAAVASKKTASRAKKKPAAAKKPGPKPLSQRENAGLLRKLRNYVETHTVATTAAALKIETGTLKKWFSTGQVGGRYQDTIRHLGDPLKRKVVKGLRLVTALDRVGPARLAKITGFSAAKLVRWAKNEPEKRLPIDQETFRSRDAAIIARELKISRDVVRTAQKKQTSASGERLETLVKVMRLEKAARTLGVMPATVTKWRKAGQVPAQYRPILLKIARDELTAREYRSRAPNRPIPDKIKISQKVAEHWRAVDAWNKKKPLKVRLGKATLELWTRTGTFAMNWRRYKELHKRAAEPSAISEALRKAVKGRKTKPLLPKKGRPEKVGPVAAKIAEAQIKDFDEAILLAYGEGKFGAYKNTENRYSVFRNEYNVGASYTWPVGKFVAQLDPQDFRDRLREIIERCWNNCKARYKRIFVQLVIAAQCEGNPFYVATVMNATTEARFFHRNVDSGPMRATIKTAKTVAGLAWDELEAASGAALIKLMQADIKVVGGRPGAPAPKRTPKGFRTAWEAIGTKPKPKR